MVLAYFMLKQYLDEIAAVRAEADSTLMQTQNNLLLQLIERNRQLIERLDRQSNGQNHGSAQS